MPFNFAKTRGLERDHSDALVDVQIQRQLPRLLAFAGWTIDDVVNNPLAKRDVYNWFRMARNMNRRLEVLDLERQWNPHR